MAVPTKNELKGTRYVFEEDTKAKFFLDFAFWQGVPSDRVFYEKETLNNGHVTLVATGYGIMGDYGNGSIFIDRKYLPKPLED